MKYRQRIIAILLVILCITVCTYVNITDRTAAAGIVPDAAEPPPSSMPAVLAEIAFESSVPVIVGVMPEPSPEPSPEPQPITADAWYGVAYEDLDPRLQDIYIPTVAEVDRVTRTMGYADWNIGEYFGYDPLQIAGVPWCICNRYDLGFGKDFTKIITKGTFHAYSPNTPIDPRLKEWAIDVITRWINERIGFEDVGRVLPKEFVYFSGNGRINIYRDAYRGGNRWGWTLPNPYET